MCSGCLCTISRFHTEGGLGGSRGPGVPFFDQVRGQEPSRQQASRQFCSPAQSPPSCPALYLGGAGSLTVGPLGESQCPRPHPTTGVTASFLLCELSAALPLPRFIRGAGRRLRGPCLRSFNVDNTPPPPFAAHSPFLHSCTSSAGPQPGPRSLARLPVSGGWGCSSESRNVSLD